MHEYGRRRNRPDGLVHVLVKCRLLGLETCAVKLEFYHNPEHGRQGVWGRWNQLQEQALPVKAGMKEVPPQVMRGTCNSANPIEAQVNKKLKEGTGASCPYGALTTKAQNILTDQCRDMAAETGFSVVADQLGQDTQSHHYKSSGKFGSEVTDRKYAERFKRGVERATGPHHKLFNHKIRGSGRDAEYYCASAQTCMVVEKCEAFHDHRFKPKETIKYVAKLRHDWLQFMSDPKAYVDVLLKVQNQQYCLSHL